MRWLSPTTRVVPSGVKARPWGRLRPSSRADAVGALPGCVGVSMVTVPPLETSRWPPVTVNVTSPGLTSPVEVPFPAEYIGGTTRPCLRIRNSGLSAALLQSERHMRRSSTRKELFERPRRTLWLRADRFVTAHRVVPPLSNAPCSRAPRSVLNGPCIRREVAPVAGEICIITDQSDLIVPVGTARP